MGNHFQNNMIEFQLRTKRVTWGRAPQAMIIPSPSVDVSKPSIHQSKIAKGYFSLFIPKTNYMKNLYDYKEPKLSNNLITVMKSQAYIN